MLIRVIVEIGIYLGKVAGALVALLGIFVLFAGASVIMKTEKAAATWYYKEGMETVDEIPYFGDYFQGRIETFTESPAEGDYIAKLGYRVIDLHHKIGIIDISRADSESEAKDIASTAGLTTAGVGVVILIISAGVASMEEE